MRASAALALAVLTMAGTACAARGPDPVAASGTAATLEARARLALHLDVAADRAADSLYADDALVVANARVRRGPPRFAGLSARGAVTVVAATAMLEGRFGWVLVDYRWVAPDRDLVEAGRATFVFAEQTTGWKIVHVHSSQVLPWEP